MSKVDEERTSAVQSDARSGEAHADARMLTALDAAIDLVSDAYCSPCPQRTDAGCFKCDFLSRVLQRLEDEEYDLIVRRQREMLDTKLVEQGLLKEIKPPITDLSPYQNRTAIEVKGKPLSETIIEDRR